MEFTRFVNSYFPDYGVYESDLRARVQEMLSGNRMLPLPIENAIFERGRSRITKDYLSLTQSVSSEMAARGFTLPDGHWPRGLTRRNSPVIPQPPGSRAMLQSARPRSR